MTPNGKVDRQALPQPSSVRPNIDQLYVAPRNELEDELATIWAEVLGTDRVGVHDDFFHLGGHSLLATRVLSRIRDGMGINLPLSSLFEVTTVEGLAIAILRQQTEEASPDILDGLFEDLDYVPAQPGEPERVTEGAGSELDIAVTTPRVS
jgi:acyl carrier protein